MKRIEIVEYLFLKKRIVFSGESKLTVKPLPGNYSLIKITDIAALNSINTLSYNALFAKRIITGNNYCFALISSKSRKIVGYYWALIGTENNTWHDNFLVKSGSALLYNAFVDKSHRGIGLYKHLIAFAHNSLIDLSVREIYTIVETRNQASLKSNRSMGLKQFSTNYLIKLLGFNLFSVFYTQKKITLVLCGSRLLKLPIYKNNSLW